MKIGFIFSGQGSQYIGMGEEIERNFKEAGEIFDIASEELNMDIRTLCFKGPEEEINRTENTQPAILTVSAALTAVVKKYGIMPEVAAGLSLGEYSALLCSSAIDFSQAVKLVKKRGRFMQEAVPQGIGTMAAILGLKDSAVQEVCREASSYGIVEPSNYNCPGQIVIGGEIPAVEKAMEMAKEKGALKTVMLSVSAPFHTSMLKPASDKLEKEIEKIQFGELDIPVIANISGDYIKHQNIKQNLVKQVMSPVLWEKTIRKMIDDEVDTFIEIGPGKVLSGFVKKIDRKKKVLNIEDMKSLEKVLEYFQIGR